MVFIACIVVSRYDEIVSSRHDCLEMIISNSVLALKKRELAIVENESLRSRKL